MTVSELAYLLVGACLALGSQMLVQLVIVPRVELRKRREDRWERHVVDLGEVLTTELDQHAEATRRAQYKFHYVRKMMEEDPDSARKHNLKDLLNESGADMREVARAYGTLVNGRIAWLVDRICNPIEGTFELVELRIAYMKYFVLEAKISGWTYTDEIYDPEQFDQVWNQERDSAQDLRNCVSKLIDNPALRRTRLLVRGKQRAKIIAKTLYRIWAGVPRKRK